MSTATNHVVKMARLSKEVLVGAYRTVYMSRRVDDKEIQLKRQNRAFFQISGVGHETIGVAVALHSRPGYDWFYPYYRDRALSLQLGVTPYDMFMGSVGAEDDPASGGRQMPSHWSSPRLHLVSMSSPTGTQVLQAVGAAEASQYFSVVKEAAELASSFHSDEVVFVTLGEGASSEGEFWESLNWTCSRKLPVLYVVEDNGYAISVPVDVQTAGGSISRLVKSFPHLLVLECDGTNFPESYEAAGKAVEYIRQRQGPALIHAHVIRPYSHSLSDDERLYKSEEVRQQESQRDPLLRLGNLLRQEKLASEKELKEIEAGVDREIREAVDQALAAEPLHRDTVMQYLYSPSVDPTSAHFDQPPKFHGEPQDHGRSHQCRPARRDGARPARGGLRPRCGGLQPRRRTPQSEGQRRRLQGDARAAAALRQRALLQFASGGGQHRGPGHGHGHARAEAGGRNPVLRLYLAGHDADSRRTHHAALALQQRLLLPHRHPRRPSEVTWREARSITASPANPSLPTCRACGW